MDYSDSRLAPSLEAATDEPASPFTPSPAAAIPPAYALLSAEEAYWAGVAEGIRQGGHALPAPAPAPPAPAPSDEPRPREPGDLLDFDPVPLRYRTDGLTPEKQREYVEALADTGVARQAAARVGLTEQSIARVRRRADARSFDLACEAAHRFGARRLRSIAYERAIEGTLKGHYYHGELVSQERVYDNRLLIHLLGKTGHLLDPSEESRAVCADWEPCMEALEQGLELPIPAAQSVAPAQDPPPQPGDDFTGEEVWREEGQWWTGFPPPPGFDGEEEGRLGDRDYQRTLTEEEEAVMEARIRREDEAALAQCCADRDRFFGLPRRGVPGFSFPMEAEACEPSGGRRPALDTRDGPVERTAQSDIRGGEAFSEGGSGG